MDLVGILASQLEQAHEILEGTMEGVEQQHMDWLPPGKANSIGSSYAHLVLSEDMIVNGVLWARAPLMKTDFSGNAGVSELMPVPGNNWEQIYHQWTRTVKTDLKRLRQYARAVYIRTGEYMESISEPDLAEVLDLTSMGMEKKTREYVISIYLTGHADNIAGEISALKGIQGLRGYPF